MAMSQKSLKRKVDGPALAPGGMDRRDGGRVPRPRQVAVYPCLPTGLGRPIRASLTDASPTSVGLTCLGTMPMGSYFVLRLGQPAGPPLLQVYHVVRTRDAGGGASLIGAQFDHVFTGVNPVAAPAATSPVPAPAPAPGEASPQAPPESAATSTEAESPGGITPAAMAAA